MNIVSPDLDRRFRDAAAQEGLLDAAYDLVDTPIGKLLVATTERGLCRIAYDAEPDREIELLARTFGVRVLRSAKPIDPARRELDEYFDGRRRTFDLPVDVALLAEFNRRVLGELARVPYGEVVTYGELAARAERPRAARAVGTVMNRNPLPIVLPCHRVIGARRHEHVDHDRAVRADLHLVRDVGRDRPRRSGRELTALVANPKHERPVQADPQLLVLVPMLGNDAVGIELDHAEGDLLAVNDAAVHAVPDPLEVERGKVIERAHRPEPSRRAARSPPPRR